MLSSLILWHVYGCVAPVLSCILCSQTLSLWARCRQKSTQGTAKHISEQHHPQPLCRGRMSSACVSCEMSGTPFSIKVLCCSISVEPNVTVLLKPCVKNVSLLSKMSAPRYNLNMGNEKIWGYAQRRMILSSDNLCLRIEMRNQHFIFKWSQQWKGAEGDHSND